MQISRQKGGKTFVRLASVFALLSAVAACGGGGDDPKKLTIKGTAATGAAMSDATITAKCATGTQTGKAATSGAYSLVVEGGALPCLLEAKMGSSTLYSMASGSGTDAVANITPITHTVVAKALGDEAKLKEAFAAPKPDALRAAATELADSLAAVRVALTGVADYTQDPFTTPFKAAHTGSDGKPVAGDAFDQQLDALQDKLEQADATLSELVSAIVANQAGGGDSTSSTGVFSLLCPAVKAGDYVNFSQRGKVGIGTFDPAKRTWTDKDEGGVADVDVTAGCEVTIKNNDGVAAIRVVFNAQGLGIWRDATSKSTDFGIAMPLQKHTIADLAGKWNMVSFDRESTQDQPMFGYGKVTVEADGKWSPSMCETAAGVATCKPWTPEFPFEADSTGKFTNGNGHGYLYKAPNGTKLYVQSFGYEYGLVVAAEQYKSTLPVVGSSFNFWDVSGSLGTGATSTTDLATRGYSVTAIDAATGSYTRSDGQVRVINKPADGMSYRAATEASDTTPARSAVIYMHAKGLLTVYGREKKDAYSFIGFSIGR